MRLLRRNGIDVRFREAQTCCGQPAFNSGYWSDAKPLARNLLKLFSDSEQLVVPSGSCASMIRVFYAELFHDEPKQLEAAKALAPRVFELSEYLVDVIGLTEFAEDAEAPKVKVTYHEACHLRRELGAVRQARKLLTALPGVELKEMEQAEVCCGFGGTFAVKYSDISGAMLRDKIERIAETDAEVVTACDVSCLMHIGGGMGKAGIKIQPLHLAQLIDAQTSRDRRI